MERLYSALKRLAAVALAVGLVNPILFIVQVDQNSSFLTAPNGLIAPMPSYIVIPLLSVITTGALTLSAGVTVTGMVTAWIEQRRAWLVALLLVTTVSILAPIALNTWMTFLPLISSPPISSPSDAPQYQLIGEAQALAPYIMPLLPVTLVLVFALKKSGAARRTEDAELAITRSPL